MINAKEYLQTYERYDRMFNERMLVSLPDVDGDELYEIMLKCINAGKDAVEMGLSPGYAGTIKRTTDEGEEEFWA